MGRPWSDPVSWTPHGWGGRHDADKETFGETSYRPVPRLWHCWHARRHGMRVVANALVAFYQVEGDADWSGISDLIGAGSPAGDHGRSAEPRLPWIREIPYAALVWFPPSSSIRPGESQSRLGVSLRRFRDFAQCDRNPTFRTLLRIPSCKGEQDELVPRYPCKTRLRGVGSGMFELRVD